MQTRIPAGAKVLLCTTTNKAIDSLDEKIYNCGHRNILAFGHASGLGDTSRKLTLPYHVAAHDSVCTAEEFREVCDRALNLWGTAKSSAADAAGLALTV